jgi:copper chaperone NosL
LSNRNDLLAVVAVLVASVACGVKADGPPHIEVDRTPCAHCGMLVSETTFAAAYRAPGGEPQVFDDIACLLTSVRREADPGALRLWFHDVPSGEWIPGAAASFVASSRLRTPMNGGLIAFRDLESARQAAEEHQGRVIRNVADLFTTR